MSIQIQVRKRVMVNTLSDNEDTEGDGSDEDISIEERMIEVLDM